MTKSYKHPDYILLSVVVILIVLGILILASVSPVFSLQLFGTTGYFLFRQIFFALLPGIILAFIVFFLPLSWLKKYSFIAFLASLILMFLVFVPGIGIRFGGAERWINLGFISFQPSELLKITFILYLAAWLSKNSNTQKIFSKVKKTFTGQKKNSRKSFLTTKQLILNTIKLRTVRSVVPKKTFLPFLVIMGLIAMLLAFQPDISTLGIFFIIGIGIYFLAATPLWHTLLVFLIGGTGMAALIKIAPYRLSRFLVFLNPGYGPLDQGFHIQQALIAIGSGGLLGVGLGLSQQKFGFLPQPMGDSIFAVWAEETGLIGSLIIISLFLFFAWRGFKIIKNAPDKFSRLTAAGIVIWIVSQAFINIGAMVGVLPLTGIPLPFISFGGSALISVLIGTGILLNISKYSKIKTFCPFRRKVHSNSG